MYLGAARLLGLKAKEVCMVAAHIDDLRDAKQCGLKTVYVKRPTEDRHITRDIQAGEGGEVDAVLDSFNGLVDLF
jgi:2-haloacid dehalogenase